LFFEVQDKQGVFFPWLFFVDKFLEVQDKWSNVYI